MHPVFLTRRLLFVFQNYCLYFAHISNQRIKRSLIPTHLPHYPVLKRDTTLATSQVQSSHNQPSPSWSQLSGQPTSYPSRAQCRPLASRSFVSAVAPAHDFLAQPVGNATQHICADSGAELAALSLPRRGIAQRHQHVQCETTRPGSFHQQHRPAVFATVSSSSREIGNTCDSQAPIHQTSPTFTRVSPSEEIPTSRLPTVPYPSVSSTFHRALVPLYFSFPQSLRLHSSWDCCCFQDSSRKPIRPNSPTKPSSTLVIPRPASQVASRTKASASCENSSFPERRSRDWVRSAFQNMPHKTSPMGSLAPGCG